MNQLLGADVRVTQRSVSSEGAGLKRDTIVIITTIIMIMIVIIIIKQKREIE